MVTNLQSVIATLFALVLCASPMAESTTNNLPNLTAKQNASAPHSKQAAELIALSKQKWQWMANKNVEALASLFHQESKFVHMSGSWKKERELEIIKSGSIWYKNTIVHDTDIELVADTAVVWSRITLEAHVRGNDVANEFTATEVYVKSKGNWQLLNLTFSSVRDTHQIEH
ncbi:nuclear transport factor 2 family protein [Saccharophagus degradans]|uniref:nuclear transport factor 2 family protein n=2 Tax=Saccharophagus degradans TaxID=86304 RepID=UPI0026E43286|nr:nuclear transport factor 2 family protein [Saccharophagus degradans]